MEDPTPVHSQANPEPRGPALACVPVTNNRFKIKFLPIKAALKLFDSTITPILLYGSEVWSPYLYRNPNFWDSCKVERIHKQFLKRLLGVNRSTTNILVRGELGRYPLSMPLNCRTNNFIKHILNESAPHSLVSQALEYENSVNHRQTIASYMNNLTDDLKKNGFNTESIALLSKHATKEALTQNHQAHWKNILNDCPKALSYKTYKSQFTYEISHLSPTDHTDASSQNCTLATTALQ